MSKIAESLLSLFNKNRIIVWYDTEKSHETTFQELELDGVEKHRIADNEFYLKYLMLLQKPDSKFLLYADFERPEHTDNWLLDIELGNIVFQASREDFLLQDLELPLDLKPWLSTHIEFFASKERHSKFVQLYDSKDSAELLTKKMLQASLSAVSYNTEDLIKAYLTAFVNERLENLEKELKRFRLFDFFWDLLSDTYNYSSASPGIYDFAIEVFQKNFSVFARKSSLNRTAEVLMSGWKDSSSFKDIFKKLSKKVEEAIAVKNNVNNHGYMELLEDDVFECIDKRIITALCEQILKEPFGIDELEEIIKQRETGFWHFKYQHFYEALGFANQLLSGIAQQQHFKIDSFEEGISLYTNSWYKIDQYYRRFIQSYRETNQNTVLNSLYQKVHRAYSNSWLLNLSNKWQELIDRTHKWYSGNQKQADFFTREIKRNYLAKGIKVFVVISDALRYECGQSLHEQINQENRFVSKLDYQVTNLPSYTQLGMASLLPHHELSFGEGDNILADGKSTLGIPNRKKVLEDNSGVRATAVLADEIIGLASRSEEAQQLIQNHDLVYVYHNKIDIVGDNKNSEENVIEAARDEIQFLMDLIKKLANFNANNIIVTSDHGFIYQNEALEESDFSESNHSGNVIKENRRFVIGSGLSHNNNVVKFKTTALQIKSDLEILIPKGIIRLRRQGAGSRFVHGGATLQETVVPVLLISKKRSDTLTKVNVDVLNKSNNRITTNIHSIKFYQQQAVGEGVQERTLKCCFAIIENEKRTVISDVFTYTFDSESKRSEDRETQYKFTISTTLRKSPNVFLLMEEKIEGSVKWLTVQKLPYSLHLTMDNDFDDF